MERFSQSTNALTALESDSESIVNLHEVIQLYTDRRNYMFG